MNLQEAIDAHGLVVASEPAAGIIVCWNYDDATLTMLVDRSMNGDYEATDAYELEGDNTPENAEAEAGEVLADLGSDNDDNEG